jgi:hypothetical protein
MTAAVQALACEVWEARYRGKLKRDTRDLGRALALSVAQDVRDCAVYDPETDVRVKWLRALMDDLRRGPSWKTPNAGTDLEFVALSVLGKLEPESCGKMRAAGKN